MRPASSKRRSSAAANISSSSATIALSSSSGLSYSPLRLLRRLAADANVPRAARVRLMLLLGYLAIPLDLVPDFVPVLGYADDAIIVSLVLRSVVRRAGAPLVRRHWPGTHDGLDALARLTGMPL